MSGTAAATEARSCAGDRDVSVEAGAAGGVGTGWAACRRLVTRPLAVAWGGRMVEWRHSGQVETATGQQPLQ